jgi:hypothetical protein
MTLSAIFMVMLVSMSGRSAHAAADGVNALSAKDLQSNAFAQAGAVATVTKPKTRSAKKVKLATKSKARKSKPAAGKRAARKKGKKVAKASAFVAKAPIRKSLVKKGGGGTFKGNVSWNAPSGCVPGALKSVLAQVSQKFGPVVVNSSVRGHKHNRRVGGARRSWHLKCMAVDFRVRGRTKGLYAFLRSHGSVGGLHRYPSGFFHIDLGPKRTW